MRLFLSILLAVSAWGATPSLVQWVDGSSTGNNDGTGGGNNSSNGNGNPKATSFTVQWPNLSKSGNCSIVAVTYSDAVSVSSVTDDQSNTYVLGKTQDDATNGQAVSIYYALNIAASTRVITTNFSGAGATFVKMMASEFNNIATTSASDGSNGHAASGTSVTAGSVTPGTSGDLVFMYGMTTTATLATGLTPGSQSNITWNLIQADVYDGNSSDWSQWGQYNSTSALNPTMTVAPSLGYVTAAIFLKNAASGSTYSGIHVNGIQHENLPSGSTNPAVFELPCTGNLLVAAFEGGSNSMSSITDTASNTWTRTTATSNGSEVQFGYAVNATCSGTLKITVTLSSVTDTTIFLYDISGAATSPFDSTAGVTTGTGTQSTVGASITGASITPSTSNGLVLSVIGVDQNTINQLTNTGGLAETNKYGGMHQDGPSPIDENNGWGLVYNTSTSAITLVWSPLFPAGQAFGVYATQAIAFKAPAAPTAAPAGALLGVGK